ncbi:MAG: hypothetical protein V2A62_00455 [Candidatus Woesearchaeota archaeon]
MRTTICAVVAALIGSTGCAPPSIPIKSDSEVYRGEVQAGSRKKEVYFDGRTLCERRGPSTFRKETGEIITPEVCYLLDEAMDVQQICTVERHNKQGDTSGSKEHRRGVECFYRIQAYKLVPGAFPEAQRRVDTYLQGIPGATKAEEAKY